MGGGLIASDLSAAFLMLSPLPWTTLDVFDVVVLLVLVSIWSAILWLGALLVKRAFVGRASEDKRSLGATET